MSEYPCIDRYSTVFCFRTIFIDYFMSIKIRKYRFETDGTFKYIIIEVGKEGPAQIINNCLCVNVKFDPSRYDNVSDSERLKYYVELLRTGIDEAAKEKSIPYEILMNLVKELEELNYSYSWVIKKIFLRPLDIRVDFIGKIDTYAYTLSAIAYSTKTKSIICQNEIARTLPDSDFLHPSQKIYISGDQIMISDSFGRDLISISIKQIIKGQLKARFCEAPNSMDKSEKSDFITFQKYLGAAA